MVLLILLWLAASVPLAILGGHSLRASGASISDEADLYLRRLTRRPRDRWVGVTLRLLVAAYLVGALATASAGVFERMPDRSMVARPGSLEIGPSTTTTTGPTTSTTSTTAPPGTTATAG